MAFIVLGYFFYNLLQYSSVTIRIIIIQSILILNNLNPALDAWWNNLCCKNELINIEQLYCKEIYHNYS